MTLVWLGITFRYKVVYNVNLYLIFVVIYLMGFFFSCQLVYMTCLYMTLVHVLNLI